MELIDLHTSESAKIDQISFNKCSLGGPIWFEVGIEKENTISAKKVINQLINRMRNSFIF